LSGRRIHVVSWRDLDAPDAGGSERHIDHLARRWVASGHEVTIRTAAVPGHPALAERDGYRVVRRGGRLSSLLRTPVAEALGRQGRRDALVEVWHGINFLAPLWARGPRVAIAHHVHADQFGYVLPAGAAAVARFLEREISPVVYRSTPLVTLSASARDEFVALGHRPDRVSVVPPGVDECFRPTAPEADHPLVIVVGRLMPQKRVDLVARALAPLRARYPTLELVVVGDGPEAGRLAAVLPPWARLTGHLPDPDLVELYSRAWVAASGSLAEGWNMTLTEAAACGTPSVATRIPGHVDAVVEGVTGLLADDEAGLTEAFDRVLGDAELRRRLGAAARERAAEHSWDRAADAVLHLLDGDGPVP
jgi:glycosyltransferase involved in cell wall biosynthesis